MTDGTTVLLEGIQTAVGEMRGEIRTLATVTTLAADALPRHEKGIDSLWSFVREREGLYPTIAQFEKSVSTLEDINARLKALEDDRQLREGRKLGSQEAYGRLKSGAVVGLKAIGVLTGLGVGGTIGVAVVQAAVDMLGVVP